MAACQLVPGRVADVGGSSLAIAWSLPGAGLEGRPRVATISGLAAALGVRALISDFIGFPRPPEPDNGPNARNQYHSCHVPGDCRIMTDLMVIGKAQSGNWPPDGLDGHLLSGRLLTHAYK